MEKNEARKGEDEARFLWAEMDAKIDEQKDLRWKADVDRDLL